MAEEAAGLKETIIKIYNMPPITRSRARILRPNMKPAGFYTEPEGEDQPQIDHEMYEAATILLTLSKGSPVRRSARLAAKRQRQPPSQPSV